MSSQDGGATEIHEDNKGCIDQMENPLHHKTTKHISICYHYAREKVDEGVIKFVQIPTEDQIADILTKPLSRIQFHKHLNKLSIRNTNYKEDSLQNNK